MIVCEHPITVCRVSCVGHVVYTRNTSILSTLAQQGFHIASITPGSITDTTSASYITHHKLPVPRNNFWYGSSILYLLRAVAQRTRNVYLLSRKLAQVRAAVLLCSEPDSWLVAVLAKWRYGCKVIVDLQEVYDDRALAFPKLFQQPVRLLLRACMRLLSSYTDEVVHVSLERQRIYSYLAKPGIIVSSYPDLAQYPPRQLSTSGDPSKSITAVHAGALRVTYGSEQLLKAMALASELMPNLRFVVLGGIAGELENMDLVDLLIEKCVLEVTGQVPRSEVIQRLYSSDIGISLVLPVDTAHYLAAPQKLFEYFAASLPVVASDVPTIRRVVEDNNCGVVVDASIPQEIADALIQLAQNAEMRNAMGNSARAAAEREYNWEFEAHKLCELMDRLTQE